MNRLDKKQIFILIIFFIILLLQYPIFFKSSFNKALAQSSNYTKFKTPYGGFIFRYSYPNIVAKGGWVYVDDYKNGREVKYTITLIPYEIDRNNNLSFWLNFDVKDSIIDPKPGVNTLYAYRNINFSLEPKYLGKLKQEYLNKKYILIPSNVDLRELKELADQEGKYRKWWYAYEIFYLILIDNERLFCDKDSLQRDCGYLKDSGYATDTLLSRSSYWDYYYGGSDKYITFKVETIENPLAAVLAQTPTSTSSPNQAATLRYLFSKLGYIDTPHDYYIGDLYYDPSNLEEDLKNKLKTKLILFKTFLPNNFFIIGSDRLKPIFIQTPTSGSPLAMAATKEYVDKMCFGSPYYYPFYPFVKPPHGKPAVLNPRNNEGVYFKKENNNFAPIFVANYYVPIYGLESPLLADKVVNKYEVDKMCAKIKWRPNFHINRSYFKADISFSQAPSRVPNSPPDNPLYDLKNYELSFTSPSTSTKITIPPTSTRITLWYPDIKRYSNISVGVKANYFSGHFAYYSTSVTDYLLYLPPPPQIKIKQIDIHLYDCPGGANQKITLNNKDLPFQYVAPNNLACYESRDNGVHYNTYCKMKVNVQFEVGPYPTYYVDEFDYYRKNINDKVPNYVTSSIYQFVTNSWFLKDTKRLHPNSVFNSPNFLLDFWIDPSYYYPTYKVEYFWFRGEDFAGDLFGLPRGIGVRVIADYRGTYNPDPSKPNLIRKLCTVYIDNFQGNQQVYYPGYGYTPSPPP